MEFNLNKVLKFLGFKIYRPNRVIHIQNSKYAQVKV